MVKMLEKVALITLAYSLMSNVECEGALKSLDELLFESFVSNYSKSYRNDERQMSLRFKVFQQSLARQKALNEAEKRLGGTARYGVNKFSDLTPEEFQKERLSPRRQLPRNRQTSNIPARRFESVNVSRFDWRDKGVIGAIRDQHQCGSCWAFAVVETIASAFAIESQTEIEHVLSAQQVISCDVNANEGLDGCNGGVLKTAFSSLQVLELVLVDEDIYPFVSKNGEVFTCRGNIPDKGVLLRNFSYYEKVDVQGMAQLLTISPLTTSVNAIPWQDYQGGIMQHHCTDTYVDHAVQVVGYDATGDVPYWIVRNTWGKDWGEDGYARIIQNNENLCGLQDEVAVVHSAVGVNL